MQATVLRTSIPSLAKGTALVERILFDREELQVEVLSPESTSGVQRVVFDSVVGWQVLDERDLPQLWRNNVRIEGSSEAGLVYEVLLGGWADRLKELSPVMKAGFYGALKEWVILGDDWCVSVLAESQPRLKADGEPGIA